MAVKTKRIAVVGAGAIGGYVGAHLSKAGHDVCLIDPWPDHVQAMRRDGLCFSGTLGDYSIAVKALHIHEVQSLASDPIDIAFICTKLYDTRWATMLIAPYLAGGGYVVTLQNSLVEEDVASVVGWPRTIGCIASTMSVDLHRAGHIKRTRQPGGSDYTIFRAGETHGRLTPRLLELVQILSDVDSAKATENLWGERWSKLVANTMTTGVSAITGLTMKRLLQDPALRPVLISLASEAIQIGTALGYPMESIRGLAPDFWTAAEGGDSQALMRIDQAFERELRRVTDEGVSGTAQDIRKKRRTEIDFMNGFVVEQGRQSGVPAPTHARIVQLVKQMERGELDPSPLHLSSEHASA